MPTAKKRHVPRTKTGKQLRGLAARMVASTDPKEVKRLKAKISRLFYANA
jgi:ribosomal protein L35